MKQKIRVLRIVDGEPAGTYEVQRALAKGGPTGLKTWIEGEYRPVDHNRVGELVTTISVNRRVA